MKGKKQLPKPAHWEDFESLCKKLWGEVWDCREIKKNGRKGQVQNGVDVYGIPKGEQSYYGIQCKGKDDYSHKQLTKTEIDREINLAKSFTPPLAKLYFATTANKDAKVEEYIRIKDLENRQNGLFEVHLFSWEDIADLIDEHKQTHDWYLNSQQFKGTPDVLVCFENDENELTGSVPFCEKHTYFTLGSKRSSLFEIYNLKSFQPDINSPLARGENKSYFRFRLKIKNIGSCAVENPKLIIQANGSYVEIEDENIDTLFISQKGQTDIEINNKQGYFFVNPLRSVLALEEEYISSIICIKPCIEGSEIELNWKLVSSDFTKEGQLKIKIGTVFNKKEVTEYVDFRHHVRDEKSIEDYYEEEE